MTGEVAEAYVQLARAIAEQLIERAPPKVDGGSPERQQWLSDVMAVQMAFHNVDAMVFFTNAMDAS